MQISPFFHNLRSAYRAELDDMRSDSEGLNILNQQPANARGMVCAFLTSAEYQLRFGTQTPRSNNECGPGV